MGKFISAAHTSDFLITQITWLYMIVSPWWESAPPSVAMALSWETVGLLPLSWGREVAPSCEGFKYLRILQVMGGCSISSNLCAVPDLHSGVSRASKQSCRCTGAPISAPSRSGDLRVLQGLNRSSFTPWICTNFFLVLRERKTSDTPDAPWGSCCSELLVYIDN